MRNLKTALLLGAAIALGTTACTKPADDAAKPASPASAPAEKASPTLVTVNGKAINSQMLDTFLQAVTGKPAAEATKEQKDSLLEQLVNMTLAAQAAEKDGLAATADVKARLDLLQMQILAEAASEKYVKSHPVSDDEVKAAYDTEVANMPKEYNARHILVEKKETADAIIKELQAGGDFAKIAKAQGVTRAELITTIRAALKADGVPAARTAELAAHIADDTRPERGGHGPGGPRP